MRVLTHSPLPLPLPASHSHSHSPSPPTPTPTFLPPSSQSHSPPTHTPVASHSHSSLLPVSHSQSPPSRLPVASQSHSPPSPTRLPLTLPSPPSLLPVSSQSPLATVCVKYLVLQTVGPLLGLTAQNVRQEDGSRASLEAVFQAVDSDNSKSISKVHRCIILVESERLIGCCDRVNGCRTSAVLQQRTHQESS